MVTCAGSVQSQHLDEPPVVRVHKGWTEPGGTTARSGNASEQLLERETLSRKSWHQHASTTLCHIVPQHITTYHSMFSHWQRCRRGPKLGATVDLRCASTAVYAVYGAVDAMDKEFPIDEHRATKQLDCRSCRILQIRIRHRTILNLCMNIQTATKSTDVWNIYEIVWICGFKKMYLRKCKWCIWLRLHQKENVQFHEPDGQLFSGHSHNMAAEWLTPSRSEIIECMQ